MNASSTRRRFGLALGAVALACSLAPASAMAAKFAVGYTNIADADFFPNMVRKAFIEAARTDADIDVKFTDANNDIARQLDQIDNFIAQKVKAIVVVPVDYEGITPGIERANKAGIPVVTLNIQAKGGKSTFVGSKNLDAGRMQGEFMVKALPQGAKVMYLQGTPGLYHSMEREQGFMAALKARKDVTVLSSLSGNYGRAEGMKITEDWVQRHPKFDAIVAANDQMALGALQALKTAGRKGVLISGIDGTADAKAAIKAGEMAQSVLQNGQAQAQGAFKVLTELKAGKAAPTDVLVPFESITKDNVARY
ncbi:MAG: hypothetical protein RL654_3347 [Pseudomonadota bacterium]|jgi:inositol transport system substrate-binding protein